MIKKREIVVSIILTFITCGIYGIVWFINMTDDVAVVSEDHTISGGKAFLFTILTCGLYSIYWSYLMGKKIYETKTKKGLMASDNSILYLILCILGLGIVNYCLIQNELNEMAS